MKLLTSFKYFEDNIPRMEQFFYCLDRNSKLEFLDEIIIFLENYNPELIKKYQILNHKKIKIIPLWNRPTFSNFFSFAQQFRNEIIVISNGDIYCDQTLQKMKYANYHNMAYAITRYNFVDGEWSLQGNGTLGSADLFCYRSPMRRGEYNIEIARNGCDSLLVQMWQKAGIAVRNCCLTVRSYHHHFVGGNSSVTFPDGTSYWNKKQYLAIKIPPTQLIVRK